jgi:hypothetical protein
MTERELLARIHELSEQALFERTSRAAAREALRVLSEINKLTAPYT